LDLDTYYIKGHGDEENNNDIRETTAASVTRQHVQKSRVVACVVKFLLSLTSFNTPISEFLIEKRNNTENEEIQHLDVKHTTEGRFNGKTFNSSKNNLLPSYVWL